MDKADYLLIRRLETGAISAFTHHTLAKARLYYIHTTCPKRRAILDKLIREAYATDDWSELCKYMKGWQ